MNPADDPAELFVCGRLCLLGEHSDWAGGFRSAARPDTVHVGRCVVVGTNDGLRARVSTSSGSDMCVAMTSTDDAGAKRSRVFDLYDDEALLRAARGGRGRSRRRERYLLAVRRGHASSPHRLLPARGRHRRRARDEVRRDR